MRTLRTTALLGVLLASVSAAAQTYYTGDTPSTQPTNFYGSVQYQFGIPIGNTYNYISDVEWRGIGLDLDWMVKPTISIGVALGWNVFYQNTTKLITYLPGQSKPGFAVYGNQDRSFNFFPLLADFRFLPKLKNGVRPFLGLGIGAYITTQQLGIGLSSFSTTQCQFGVAPELGVLIPIDAGSGVQLSTRYNMAFKSGGIPFEQWLGIYLGFVWGGVL
ncbi:MAG: hypothetical protein ACLQDQ_16300 [Myxococcaceae bacterium]